MTHSTSNQDNSTVLQELLNAINSLRFGSVEITVHEGRVTQIEKREKVRFVENKPETKPIAPATAKNFRTY